MDAYDIFKKLTKGLKFKNPVISIKNQDKNATRQAIKQELIEVKKEEEFSDFENSDEGVSDARSESSDDEKDQLELVQGVQVGKRKKKTKDKEKTDDIKKKLIIEEQNRFRNEYGIKAVGRHIPAAIQDFEDLMKLYNVSEKLVKTVRECGYAEPTPIQRQALPCMLERRQIFACAPTGSGKTAAFLIPILHTLGAPQGGPRALILCPTRELAVQIYREALRLSAGTDLRVSVVRKMQESKIKEREATIRKSDIVISTPNRLCYLLNQDNVNIKLDKVRWLIIDEADKLFEGSTETESDFRQQMEQIMSSCDGKERQVAMFSATHTPRVAKWCRHHMRGLINVTVGQRNAAASSVQQELLYCGSENGKLVAFRQLVQKGLNPPVLVFVQSKDRAKQLFKELIYDGINVDVIHADRTQAQRDNVVRSFRIGRIWVLICTELMGRGIDFRGVNLVINYDFPPSAIAYIHRIGRAGRAGQTGKAITFFTQDDVANLRSIAAVIKQSGCAVPEYMLQLKQNQNKRKKLVTKAPRRDDIRTILDKRPDKRKLEDGNEAQQGEKQCKGVETIKSGRNNKQRKIQNGGKFIKNNGSKDGNNKGKVFNKNRKGFSKGEGKENKKNPKQLKKKQRNAFSKKKAKKNVS